MTTDRRLRIVSIRLSAGEYESLIDHCTREHGRNASDFARSLLLESLNHSGNDRLEQLLSSFLVKVDDLDQAIKKLTYRLDTLASKEGSESTAGRPPDPQTKN